MGHDAGGFMNERECWDKLYGHPYGTNWRQVPAYHSGDVNSHVRKEYVV